MPADAWVALILGLLTVLGTIAAAAWKLSGQLSKAITRLDERDSARTKDIDRLTVAVDKIQDAVQTIAVDRARTASLEQRVSKLEQWYDELRRGVGRIENPAFAPLAR